MVLHDLFKKSDVVAKAVWKIKVVTWGNNPMSNIQDSVSGICTYYLGV